MAEAGFADAEGMGVFGLPGSGDPHRQIITQLAEASVRTTVVPSGLITNDELDELILCVQAGEVVTAWPYAIAWGRRP